MTVTETPATLRAFRIEDDGATTILHFDLPGEKVNKFSTWVVEELDRAIDEIAPRQSKVLLIVSDKPSIFIAGADIEEFTKITSTAEAEELVRRGQRVFGKISRLSQVTVAVINGACLGGGTELALACDYRAMSDSPKAVIGLPEVKLGIFPAWGGTTRLPRLVGIPTALDLILTGRTLNAKRAKRAGLVDEILPQHQLLPAAKKYASSLQGKRRGSNANTHIYLEGNPLARKMVFRKARAATLEKTGGHYPAPLRAIDVMETGYSQGLQKGLDAEAVQVASLLETPAARNLVQLFFLMEEAKKESGPKPESVSSAGVLGAGLMGAGIAQIIADKADIDVRMKDVNWQALGHGMKAAARVWQKKAERSRMSRSELSRKLSRISTTTDWSGFGRVDLVIEAVVENLEVKKSVLRELEAVQKEGAIFATNTSTIPIGQIAADAKRPDRVIGMHFFSPVDKMPLLEVIRGEKTSDQTVSTVVAFGRKIGKTVVVCKDGPGFIVNRILGPYMNEATYLLREGNRVETIDDSMVKFGMPLGPMALLDEVGIDVAFKAGKILQEAFGDRVESSGVLEKLVADERLGKKNGRGVYRWSEGKRTSPDPSVYAVVGASPRGDASADAMVERMVLAMVNEASLVLEEGIAATAGDVDLSMIMGTGFPPFRGGLLRYADSLGVPYVVARLSDLEAKHGRRFAAAAPLRDMAAKGSGFYERYGRR